MAEPTFIKVTGKYKRPDGSVASGTVTATLSERIVNGTQEFDPTPVVGELNSAGELKALSTEPFMLVANDDPETKPVGSSYSFVVKLDNAPIQEFEATIKHTVVKGEVNLSELESP